MNNTLTYIIVSILILMNLKWIIIITIFPFQTAETKRRMVKETTGHRIWYLYILAVPYVAWELLMRNGWQRFMLYQVGTIPSLHLRRWVYKCLGANIESDTMFHFKTEIRAPERLIVRKGALIGDNAILDARGGLEIGESANLSSNVSIYTLQHNYRDPDFRCTELNAKVTIGKYAWLGSNVIVLPGVTIGEGAVCCAGCVVTKDVEPYAVVAGIPAKKINERPQVLRYEFKSKECCRLY